MFSDTLSEVVAKVSVDLLSCREVKAPVKTKADTL